MCHINRSDMFPSRTAVFFKLKWIVQHKLWSISIPNTGASAVDLGPWSPHPSPPLCIAISPPQWYPPPRAPASRGRRPLPTAPGRASAHRSPLDAHLRGARPLWTPRHATTTVAGRAALSVSLVASGSGSARRSLPCPPPDVGFPRTKPWHPPLQVWTRLLNWDVA
jgi:hypothetical protein